MFESKFPITDHRGRAFTLWRQALMPDPGDDSESREDARNARRIVWRSIDPQNKRRIRWLLCGSILLAVGIGLEVLFSGGRWHSQVRSLFWAFYLVFGIITTWRTAIVARSTSVCTDLLTRSLCPSCGYHLRGLTPDPDHCTTCPECGAAWKLP